MYLVGGGVVIALVICIIGLLAAWNYPYDVIFGGGMLVLVVGILASMKGGAKSPFGQFGPGTGSSSQAGIPSSPYLAQGDRGRNSFYQAFLETSVAELQFWPLMCIVGGMLAVLVSVLFA